MVAPERALCGLIFAVEEAQDRPGTLVASLPFGGMTLLEYQIRLLAGIGAEQVLVAVGKVTPQFLAAIERAGRGRLKVDIVRSAEEGGTRPLEGPQTGIEGQPAVPSVQVVVAARVLHTQPYLAEDRGRRFVRSDLFVGRPPDRHELHAVPLNGLGVVARAVLEGRRVHRELVA